MAQIVNYNDPRDRVRAVINFNCGKCEKKVEKWRFIERNDPVMARQGFYFECHGDTDFLEISDSMLLVPKRVAGWQPFSKFAIAKRQKEQAKLEQLERDLRKKILEVEAAEVRQLSPTERRIIIEAASRRREAAMKQSIEYGEDIRWRGIRPKCAVCDRPVDAMRAFRNEMTLQTVFQFRCHGKSEDVPVDEQEMRRSPDFVMALKNYIPFAREAEILRQAQMTPGGEFLRDQNGSVIGYVSANAGGTPDPDPSGKPSLNLTEFMARLMDDITSGNLTARQISALLNRAPALPTSQPKPPPKKETLLIAPTKPRVIILED